MTEKNKEQMLEMLDIMLNEDIPYSERLKAYEYLLEDCDEIVDDMLEKSYSLEGDTGKMLMEVLAQYKGNKAIFMGLVSYLYKGDDVALFAKLIGSYGDEQGIQVLKTFCDEYEPNYNEYMELRNAVEELGGDFDMPEDFEDDPLYRYLKGLDDVDDRRSPFEGLWQDGDDGCEDDGCECHHHGEDDCDDGCDCHHEHHGADCDCHHEHHGDCGCHRHDGGCGHGSHERHCGCHHDGCDD